MTIDEQLAEWRAKGLEIEVRGALPAVQKLPEKPQLRKRSFVAPATWVVPLYIYAGDNARGMRQAIGRAGHERKAVAYTLAGQLRAVAVFADRLAAGRPVTVRLTRVGGRGMDDDNVVAACKYVRDAVALFLGVDDRSPLVSWRCDAEPGGAFGVRITME